MSKVISFRLNPENPREAEALTILNDWLSQGFSTRYIMTEALMNSAHSQVSDSASLNDLLNQIKELLTSIGVGSSIRKPYNHPSSKKQLSQEFIVAIKKTAKLGINSR